VTYYPTIEEDLKRAREILERGKTEQDSMVRRGFSPATADALQKINGGTIWGSDSYAAYKLLESFVAEIERLRAAPADNPFDHNGECVACDEQGMHRADCPWLLQLIAALAAARRDTSADS
jgi:hypothetical protein